MNYTKLSKKALLLLATPVIFSLAVPASKLVAQSQTETKIRLMAEGLRARDSGDLATAKSNFEQLLVLAPNDVTVQRLLTGVNDSIASGGAAAVEAPAVSSASSAEPVEVAFNPGGKARSASSARSARAASSANVAEVSLPAGASSTATDGSAAAVPASPADALAQAEEARVQQLLQDARAEAKAAQGLAKDGDYDAASARYDAAIRSLPLNTLTERAIDELETGKNELLLNKSSALLKQGDVAGAKGALDAYIAATSPEAKAARRQAARINQAELNPPLQPIEKANPRFVPDQKQVAALLSTGRSRYAAGDLDGARETFSMVETYSADNAEAKYFLKRISEDRARLGVLNREKSRSLMLEEVSTAWQRAGVFVEKPVDRPDDHTNPGGLGAKMERIMLPNVSFFNQELGKVVTTLGALSSEYDAVSPEGEKGVNIVLSNPLSNTSAPLVNVSLSTRMSLKRVLDIIGSQTGYQIEVQSDLVLLKPSGTDVNLDTQHFAVSKAAITRMTGAGGASAPTPAANDPFASPAPAGGGGASAGAESGAIRNFLQAAGVPFDSVPNSSLAYDGASILVTQTNRNLERIRNILNRYNDVRQVEIEAKFLDVNEGSLEELGISWTAKGRGSLQYNPLTGAPMLGTDGKPIVDGYKTELGTANRTLSGAFTSSSSGGQGSIIGPNGNTIPINNSPPSLPGTVDLGGGSSEIASIIGSIGGFDVTASLRALSQRTGSDLLSAPKVTVLSGNRATVTVGQELRYPQSYGEIESEVGSSSATVGGSTVGGGVTITAGTPEDFTMRNVGVELAVTPTVEEDDYSISLELNPRVTEFEGFVEYGGSSVAISGGTTITVPSGFYQPVFSTREINTRVTVWDGATLVMGGLTREEVKRVNDKVPVLGDIPFIGRAFRSKGESSQKRNLLIFVTANLVSPGGSLKKQDLRRVPASATFQNPSVVTPSGPESRVRSN